MLIQDLERQLLQSRSLLRDLFASLVGLAAGVALIGLLTLEVPPAIDTPEATPTAIAAAGASDPGADPRIADLEVINELLTAALARLAGGLGSSVLPPLEIVSLR